ncbi:MAG: hypothetical protein MUQ32_15245, partial [Chloroflexi bacterium]|nr:hypothetical protein [Chloroflexota bacterium]
MTTPPIDPVTPAPGLSTSLTEPVPTFQPGFAPPEPEAAPATPDPAPRPASQKRGSSGSSRILNLALGAAVLVAVAGVSFAVGRATAPASEITGSGTVFAPGQGGVFVPGGNGGNLPDVSFDPNGNGGFPGGVGQGRGIPGERGFGGFGGGLAITGTVDAISADSITLKLESGQTITVGLDASTTYHQQADAAASDVTTGDTVQLQMAGGFRPGQIGNGNSGNAPTLGSAGSVTIVP